MSPAARGRSRRAGRWSRWALAALSGLAALLSIELAARVAFAPPVYRANLRQDPELGFRMQPLASERGWDERGEIRFRLNGAGFRGPELPDDPARVPAREHGVQRLLFVGDSMLYARAVRDEELVSRAVVRELAAAGVRSESFDLACPDYGTAQELMLLERHGPRLRPDAVVLLLFPGNDVANNCLELAGRTLGNDGDYLRPYLSERGTEVRYVHPLRAFLRNRLRSFACLEQRLLARAAASGWSWPTPWGDLERTRAGDEIFRAHAPASAWATAWERTEELLCVFRDRARSLGARLLVVVVPERNQVQREAYSRALHDRSGEGAPLDWNLPERRLGAFFAREGIDALLLLEDFRAAMRADAAPLFAQDLHLSGRAHALAASHIAGWVRGAARGAGTDAGELGEPVDLLALERCPSYLDFGERLAFECLDRGFGTCRPDWLGQGAGVAMAASGVLVLKPAAGDFVARGLLPQKRARPLELELSFDGRPLEPRFVLARSRTFDVRVAAADLPALGPLTEVRLRAGGSAASCDEGWTLILQEIGFTAGREEP